MKKIFELPERFITGEPTLLVVAHWTGDHHVYEKAASYRAQGVSTKLASPAFDYIQQVQPREGETIILVNAIGAFEWYDDNRNGDAFNESPYMVGIPVRCGCEKCSRDTGLRGWINEDEVITRHHQSYEKHGGIYTHHANKDPSRSLGKVEKAFWNPGMHRVELLLALRNDLCPDWIEEIENGIYAPVSMGCHVRWDVCSNCGHRAPTRREYCEHLKFAMRRIDPRTGVRNCALNPSPKLFDISKVFKPADQQAFMIKKVAEDGVYAIRNAAELGEKVASYEEKQARIGKLSDIHKVLVGDTLAAKKSKTLPLVLQYRMTSMQDSLAGQEPAGPTELSEMSGHPLPEVASTLAAKEAGLTSGEIFSVLCKRAGFPLPDPGTVDRAVYLQPVVTSVFTRYPHLLQKLSSLEIDAGYVRPGLADRLGSWLTKRAGIRDWVRAEVGRSNLPGTQFIRDTEPARTDLLYYTDPRTGHSYHTTRGAVMAAHDEESRADLVRRLGGALLLSGGYRMALGGLIPGYGRLAAPLRMAIPVGAGMMTSQALLDHYHPTRTLTSDEGYGMPATTEMEKVNAFDPLIPAQAYYDLIAFDYASRIGPGTKLAMDLESQLLDAIRRHDPSSDVTKLAAYRWSPGIGRFEQPPGDPTEPPEIDLDGLCQDLGARLVG